MRVGLVGAGPWARMMHAPLLTEGDETELVGVWARRPEAARELAHRFGTEPVDSFPDLLERCEAVAFAVPPDVQAGLATAAAAAGKHLLLDKPTGLDAAQAAQLADAAAAAGVISLVVLTNRYADDVRAFLESATAHEITGVRCASIGGAFLDGSPFATPWRLQHGVLADLGPHVFDLAEALAGPVERLQAVGDPHAWVSLSLRHRGGAVTSIDLCATLPLDPGVWQIAAYGPGGADELRPAPPGFGAQERERGIRRRVRQEFATAVRQRKPHPLDAAHGAHLAELVQAAHVSLR